MLYERKIKIFLEIYKNIDKENFVLETKGIKFRTIGNRIVISSKSLGTTRAILEKEFILYLRWPVKKINLLSVIEDYREMDQTQFILTHGKEPFGDFSFFENIDMKDIEHQLNSIVHKQ